jgi:hypothetical protein
MKGFAMKTRTKSLLIAALAPLLGAGCFGSDPNMNSQIYLGAGGSSSTGTGGAGTGSGGTSGNPNGPIVGTPLATFDTGLNNFVVNPYHDTGQINLGDPGNTAGATPPIAMFDGSTGSPTAGSLTVTAPFSGANQYIDLQNTSMFQSMPANWMGGTLHVRIKADSGSFAGVVEPYAITVPTKFIFGGTSTNANKTSNDWQEFTVNINTPGHADSGYDPTQVIIFGVQINSGSSGASQQPITFHIDSFSIAGLAAGSGGAGGATGSGGAAGGHGDAGGSGGGAGGTTGAAGANADGSAGG